jgi:RNA polymerase sigma-B factor
MPQLAALPEREQQILAMRFVEELSQLEIAQRLGISQMHVSRLLARTLSMLHRSIETQPEPAPQGRRADVARRPTSESAEQARG